MKYKEQALVVLAVIMVALVGLLGYSPNIMAETAWDTEIITVTLLFDDGTNTTLTDGQTYNLTMNQTKIAGMSIYATHLTYTFSDLNFRMVFFYITGPNGHEAHYYPGDDEASWTNVTDGTDMLESGYYNMTLVGPERYDISDVGNYFISTYQVLMSNETWEYETPPISLVLSRSVEGGGAEPEPPSSLGIGDWAWFEMTLGFVGIIGFVATPMVTAKLMSSKDPITLMSAFMICMIMFGTFIYVFLLGGS